MSIERDDYVHPGKRFTTGGFVSGEGQGLSVRDYFAGQALANGEICTGQASEYYLTNWFGDRGGVTREEIAVRQAYNHADAMIAERDK